MEYRFKRALNEECLEMEDPAGQIVYFDKAGFAMQLRDNLRLELQKKLKPVIKGQELVRHEHLIKYTALEKYRGELYLVRQGLQIKELAPLIPAGLEEACRILLTILKIMQTYHEHGIPLGGLSPGQLKRDAEGIFKLQDPPVLNFLSASLGSEYRIDLPPEVIRGQKWNESADVFSWGALAYRLLGGADPFLADCPEDRVEKIIRANFIPLKDLQPRLSPRLSRLIIDCINPAPNRRPTVGGLIEELTVMTGDGSYQVSDREAVGYTAKAESNRKKYQRREQVQLWFKKYRVPVYIGLAVLLFLAAVIASRQKNILTVHTPPKTVVDYYYRGIKNLDPIMVNQTLYKVKSRASFDEMITNLYVLSKGRQYMSRSTQDAIKISFPAFQLALLAQNNANVSYQADYVLKISTGDRISYIQRTEELTLQPIRKIWRITAIRVLKEKRWAENPDPTATPLP